MAEPRQPKLCTDISGHKHQVGRPAENRAPKDNFKYSFHQCYSSNPPYNINKLRLRCGARKPIRPLMCMSKKVEFNPHAHESSECLVVECVVDGTMYNNGRCQKAGGP